MNSITFVPVGGLANRMRAIASAIVLAQQTNSNLEIVWFQTWGLKASFDCLFKSIGSYNSCHNVSLKEASVLDVLTLDRPRNKNLYLPRFYQAAAFKKSIYERSLDLLVQQKFDFSNWVKTNKNVYLASYSAFFPYDYSLISQLFVPVKEIEEKVNNRCQLFMDNVVGVHVRRTDNVASIKQSPLDMFFEKIEREIEQCANTSVYLATDSEEVKYKMKQRYGKRIFCADSPANRDSALGIQEGVVDMYTLARTKKIYGSFQSSFSEMASQIGNVPLVILKKE